MDVLEQDHTVVDQHADRKRQAAQGHDVDGLTGQPQAQDRGHHGEGNDRDHDQGATPASQEQKDDQPDQNGAEGALAHY